MIDFKSCTEQQDELKRAMEKITNSGVDVRLTDLRIVLGPELRILYPLILNFAASGELELNGMAHHKLIRPKGLLTFENGNVNLVATQVKKNIPLIFSYKFICALVKFNSSILFIG